MKTFIVILLAMLLFPLMAESQDCIDYGDYLHWVGGLAPEGMAWGVAISGTYAYVAGDYSGLQVIDITNPENPQITGSVDTPGSARGVAISGTHAYVADDWSGLQVIDITNPESPQIVGFVDTHGDARGVAISGTYAYVAANWSGLQVIDITNPEIPQIVGVVYLAGEETGVAVSGNFAYVTIGGGTTFDFPGFHVIDVTNPQSPPNVYSVDTPGQAVDVALSGSYAYVAAYYDGLQVVNPSLTGPQVLVGSVDTPGPAVGVAISGTYAYVAAGHGLYVIDIANPQSPQITGSVDTPGSAQGVAISGTHAYVVGADFGLQVIDITNPEIPQTVGSVDTPGSARGVAISGTYAYVADSSSGLQVIDITDPQNPHIISYVDNPFHAAYCVALLGNYAYVSSYVSSGPSFVRIFGFLQVIEVSDPESPQVVGGVIIPQGAGDLVLSGNHAYLAEEYLCVIDIADPTNPHFLGGSGTLGSANCVAASGDLFLVGGSTGLQVLPAQCDPPSAVEIETPNQVTHLFEAYPNPFNPQTTISFSLERPVRAEIGVYDLTGSRVAVLATRTFTPGAHSLTWNGRDSQGRAMPSGTYIVRLETESGVEAKKVMLVR